MRLTNFFYFFLAIALIQACAPSPEAEMYRSKEALEQDETSSGAPPPPVTQDGIDLGARLNLDQPGRKFLRSSQTQFLVKNARQATQKIEDICARYGGFITYTKLQSDISRTQRAKISQDSTQVKEYYTVSSEMTLRVPQENLDSVIRAFNPLVEFLHYRILEAKDVQLQLLAEQMQSQRDQSLDNRLGEAIQNKEDAPLDDVLQTESYRHQKQNQADYAKLERMKLEDQIAYSELKVYLSQAEVYRSYRVAHVNPIRLPFMNQIGLAFQRSLLFLQAFSLILVELWYLILLAGIAFWGYHRFYPKASKTST